MRTFLAVRPTSRGHVDDGLFDPIDPYNAVCPVVIKSPDCTDPHPEGAGSQVEVLPDVPCIEIDIPIGPLPVFPPGRPLGQRAHSQGR